METPLINRIRKHSTWYQGYELTEEEFLRQFVEREGRTFVASLAEWESINAYLKSKRKPVQPESSRPEIHPLFAAAAKALHKLTVPYPQPFPGAAYVIQSIRLEFITKERDFFLKCARSYRKRAEGVSHNLDWVLASTRYDHRLN